LPVAATVSGVDVATFVIALVGLVVATGSAVWQGATFVLSGARVKVELHIGAMGRGGISSGARGSVRPVWIQQLAVEGFTRPVIDCVVRNVGRAPVTIHSWDLTSAGGMAYHPIADSIG